MDLLSFFFRSKSIFYIQHYLYIYSALLRCCCISELPPCPTTITCYLLYILPNSQWIFPVFFFWMRIDILYYQMLFYICSVLFCCCSISELLIICYMLMCLYIIVENCAHHLFWSQNLPPHQWTTINPPHSFPQLHLETSTPLTSHFPHPPTSHLLQIPTSHFPPLPTFHLPQIPNSHLLLPCIYSLYFRFFRVFMFVY